MTELVERARHRPRAARAGRRGAALGGRARRRPPGRRADGPRHRGPADRRGPVARLRARRPGPIRHWAMPSGPGVRVDTGLRRGDRDPARVRQPDGQGHGRGGPDRPAAIDRLRRALDETEITGIQTTLPFHRRVVRDPAFAGRRPLDGLGRGALGRTPRRDRPSPRLPPSPPSAPRPWPRRRRRSGSGDRRRPDAGDRRRLGGAVGPGSRSPPRRPLAGRSPVRTRSTGRPR